jgi:phosphatidylglycerophosphate synthase
MEVAMIPWDQQIARALVKPLVHSPVTPNQLTIVTLMIALGGAAMLAQGTPYWANWGAGLFVFARFLDHADGELARQKNMKSKLGYYLDYISGGLSYGALFICMGVGFHNTELGLWAIALGAAGSISALGSVFTNLGIDKASEAINTDEGEAVGYPGFAGFELEDGIYLLAPITWAGWLYPFFVAAGIGATVYGLWALWALSRLKRKQ